MKKLFREMIGASRLDVNVYEQVEADRLGSVEAVLIVLIASVAAALGSGITDFPGIAGATLALMASWMVWVGLAFVIGTRVLPAPGTHHTMGDMLRATGLSASPGILRIFGMIPTIGWFILLAVTVWMLCTFVLAVRQSLDYSGSGRALAVCSLTWLIHGLLFFAFVVAAV